MRYKKHHPDKNKLYKQTERIAAAMQSLTRIGIEIMTIDCTHAMPRIEVFNCPSVERLQPEKLGCGHNLAGDYVRKMAQLQGCQIEWSETCP